MLVSGRVASLSSQTIQEGFCLETFFVDGYHQSSTFLEAYSVHKTSMFWDMKDTKMKDSTNGVKDIHMFIHKI